MMKRRFISGLVLATACSFTAIAMAGAPTPAPAPTPTSQMDQVSYAIGYNVGSDFKKQNVQINPQQIAAGMQAALTGQTPAITQAQMEDALKAFQTQMVAQMKAQEKQLADNNLQKSEAFMAQVAKRPGVQKLADGLYYQVLTKGTGPMPTATDTVKVNYEGRLIDGTVFDSSFKRGQPVTFSVNQVIPGWTQALQKMPVGSTWTLYIAPDLAYGKFAPPQIGPNQALVFKVQLLGIVPASSDTAQVNLDKTQ